MFTTYDLRGARAVQASYGLAGVAYLLKVPAFLGSGAFLATPDPRGPDDDDMERWEDDGGPAPPQD